ncbi:unnamed protein product [Durusdinium trenchii]|uniref:Zinc-ribbon domain-containing protein n=1 Tax=Durusdinium trenchii TaxID=1381693 RepID=A0ABP0HSW1_9DINO
MAILDQEHQQRIPVKVTAFRQFAANLMAQLTEQLCLEFEREVSAMTEDLVLYQGELARCGELLAHQLGRERQLHGMLESMAGSTGSLAVSAGELGKNAPNEASRRQLHELVEQLFGHSTNLLSNTVNGVNEAYSVAHSHLTLAKELRAQTHNAEMELNRIMALLGAPPAAGRCSPPQTAVPGQLSPIPQAKGVQNSARAAAVAIGPRPVGIEGAPSTCPTACPLTLAQSPVGLPPARALGGPVHGASGLVTPGNKAEATCIKCGSTYAADSNFCRRCGHKRIEAVP